MFSGGGNEAVPVIKLFFFFFLKFSFTFCFQKKDFQSQFWVLKMLMGSLN